MIHLSQQSIERKGAPTSCTGAVLMALGMLIGPSHAAHAQGADTGYAADPASLNAGLPMPASGGAVPAQDMGMVGAPAAGPRVVPAPASPPVSQADSNAGFAVPAHQP